MLTNCFAQYFSTKREGWRRGVDIERPSEGWMKNRNFFVSLNHCSTFCGKFCFGDCLNPFKGEAYVLVLFSNLQT